MADGNRVEAQEVRRVLSISLASYSDVARTFFIGVGVGIIVSVCMFLLKEFVFTPMLCGGETDQACQNTESYSMIVSMIIGALVGLIALTMTQVYRPLLVVLAATLAMWGYSVLIGDIAWYWGYLVAGLLFGLAYALFAWLVRLRSFLLALIVVAVLVVIVRLVLTS